ncbi:MAG TPA: hypothetical protein DEO88_02095 [Syntrophobacteraceae bacterium]|nr:hypothetical protein [Syntrophobacteraceae bacterium]
MQGRHRSAGGLAMGMKPREIWGRWAGLLWLLVVLLGSARCGTTYEARPRTDKAPETPAVWNPAPGTTETRLPPARVPESKTPIATPPVPGPGVRASAPPPRGTSVVEKSLDTSGVRHTVVHEVAPMESIWRIAKMYDVTEQGIYEANHLQPGEPIRIGQKLTIPRARGLRNIVPLYANPRWKYLVIHHTATEIGKATIIHNSHHDRGFWQGLGYHFLIDNGTLGKGDGQIEVSPRWIKQQMGAHCQAGGMNTQGIGIALVGNFNYERPTPAQMEALVYLVTTLRQYYRIPATHVVGHRDIANGKTDCPGRNFPWHHFFQQVRS